jgi:hypothetical protein
MEVKSSTSLYSAMLWSALANLKKLRTVHIDIHDGERDNYDALEETFFQHIFHVTQIR